MTGTTLVGIANKPTRLQSNHDSQGLLAGTEILNEIKTIWPVCLAGFAYAGFLYSVLGLLPRIADHAGAQLQQIGYILAVFWGPAWFRLLPVEKPQLL